MSDTEKALSAYTFRELDRKALIKHAMSLGKVQGLEALAYLRELNAKIPFSEEMKAAEREKLSKKTKQVRDKTSGNLVDTGVALHTSDKIEKLLNKKKTVQKYDNFTQKRMYCEKYWSDIVPQKKQSTAEEFDKMIAAAEAELKGTK